MYSRLGWVVAAVVVAVCAGCGDKPKGGPRVETFPLTGTVLVDGAPLAGVLVACNPQSETAAAKHRLETHTDDQGAFSIGTYEAADGLPEGVYKLTFELMEGLIGGTLTDRLKGAYSDPKKSKFTVTIKKGEENDLGEIKLTTK